MKNELKSIDEFFAEHFFYKKSMKNAYKIKCPNCKEFFLSYMTGESSDPIELFKFIKSSVKGKKEKGTTLIINCPKCNFADSINFKGKIHDDDDAVQ